MDAGFLVLRLPHLYCHIIDTKFRSENAGQSCIDTECLIVRSSQYDETYTAIVEYTKWLLLGCALSSPQDDFVPAVQYRAILSSNSFVNFERVLRLKTAKKYSAIVDMGGKRWTHSYLEHGAYFNQTAMGNVDLGARVSGPDKCVELIAKKKLY